jgi:hypothetical protein
MDPWLASYIPRMGPNPLSEHDWQPVETARGDIRGRWKCSRCRSGRYIRYDGNEGRLWLEYYDGRGMPFDRKEPPCSKPE